MSALFGLSEIEASALAAGVAPRGDTREGGAGTTRFARAAWTCLVEPGDGVAGLVVGALGPVRALSLLISGTTAEGFAAAIADSPVVDPDLGRSLTRRVGEGIMRWRPRLDRVVVERSLALAQRTSTVLLTPEDSDWPRAIDDLGPHSPLGLWVRGRVEALSSLHRSLALVGARAATEYGIEQTAEAANGLVGRGFAIVSGAAYGIDGVAHREALRCEGTTIAFLAGGVDRPYPAGHRDLIQRIIDSGAVLSEVPSGGAPTRWRFLQRNRLIAAASAATVVVEAGWRSGSLNTAGHAAALGRPLGAVPGPVDSATSSGCHRLIREYAAVCVTNPAEMAELVDGALPGARHGDDSGTNRTGDETRVIDALSVRSPRTTDDIARRAGLPVATVEAVLGLLELEGVAGSRDEGWVYRAKRR